MGEVWRGIANARNFAGTNETDNEAVRRSARQLYDMLTTRRLHGNFAREEFRAVALMSWLHLAVMFNSPVVVDLRAEASSPELRLAKIAERVGIKPHPESQALFLLAQPASFLMIAIEQGIFNGPLGAQSLYLIPRIQRQMEVIIDQYGRAMGRDVKTRPVATTRPAVVPPRIGVAVPPRIGPQQGGHRPIVRTPHPPLQLAAPRGGNGVAVR